ncbi:hypothetical protein ACQJBY_050852 [Aegilops geniculata]
MCAARNIRAQRDRLLQHQLRLQQPTTADHARAAMLEKLVSGLVHASDVHSMGLEAGSRYLATCLEMAALSGARLDLDPALADMPDEQLYDALLAQAQRLPARPATLTEAFSRVEASFHAVKLAQEHHLPRCIDHLVKIARAPQGHGPRRRRRRHGRKTAPPEVTGMDEAAVGSMDEARTYLDRACTLASLGVEHIDVAVATISRFLDPADVAETAAFASKVAIMN